MHTVHGAGSGSPLIHVDDLLSDFCLKLGSVLVLSVLLGQYTSPRFPLLSLCVSEQSAFHLLLILNLVSKGLYLAFSHKIYLLSRKEIFR